MSPQFSLVDVAGIGENATDTVIQLPRFPQFNTSTRIESMRVLPGGQVATAMVACAMWGLRTRYFGKVGSDAAGALQIAELRQAGVEAHIVTMPGCNSQSAYILVDGTTGERTILFERDERLSHTIDELPEEGITSAKVLHVDGHAAHTHAQAARWARSAGVSVVADVDNLYPGHEDLLAQVDYLVGSHDLAQRLSGLQSHVDALPAVAHKFGNRIVAATLGKDGVLAYEAERGAFTYSPAYAVKALDTTGAGDVFHAGFVFGIVQGWHLSRILSFSCAAAALNCLSVGARGGLKPLADVESFRIEGTLNEPLPELRGYWRGESQARNFVP